MLSHKLRAIKPEEIVDKKRKEQIEEELRLIQPVGRGDIPRLHVNVGQLGNTKS